MAPPQPTLEQILNGPAQKAPLGEQYDFIHPWSMKDAAVVVLWTLYALSTLVFAVRMFAQIGLARRFYKEDYVLLLTWVGLGCV
jgi:hypothetical protein